VLWVIASLLHLLGAFVETAALAVTPRPAVARWLISSAFLQLVGTILVLVGSAVFTGDNLSDAGAGAIIWLIGFTLWMFASLMEFGVALMVATAVVLMPTMLHRNRAWHGLLSSLLLLISLIFFALGSILFIARDPPGTCVLVAALLRAPLVTDSRSSAPMTSHIRACIAATTTAPALAQACG
jgi:hypothetical protein